MSIQDQRFKVAEPKVAVEDFDGEFVVLNLESGEYFSFADAGALIWQGLAQGMTANELVSGLEATSPRTNEILGFIAKIIDAGLVIAVDDAVTKGDADLISRISKDESNLSFEAFDDLAALLVADPIHDVEREAGWPHKAPE